jgi:predicted nuclease of predicted toxin-antitoxin system
MKLLVDMNLSPRWVERFAAVGFDREHWSNLGPADASDVDIMAYAGKHDYVVITNDLDFGSILAATQGAKPSVVQIRSDNLDQDKVGGMVMRAL